MDQRPSRRGKEDSQRRDQGRDDKALPQATLDSAWKRLEITYDPVSASLLKSAEDAHRIGFLKEKPDLSRIYDLKFLNEALKEKGLAEVK